MIPCSVTKIKIPSACSLLQECGYSARETTSCSASYVDGALSKERAQVQPPSRTAADLLRVHSKHFFAVPTTGSDLMSYKASHHSGKCMGLTFNQSRCRGALMGQVYPTSPRKKNISLSHSELLSRWTTIVQVFPGLPCVQQWLEPPCSKSTQAYQKTGNPKHTYAIVHIPCLCSGYYNTFGKSASTYCSGLHGGFT